LTQDTSLASLQLVRDDALVGEVGGRLRAAGHALEVVGVDDDDVHAVGVLERRRVVAGGVGVLRAVVVGVVEDVVDQRDERVAACLGAVGVADRSEVLLVDRDDVAGELVAEGLDLGRAQRVVGDVATARLVGVTRVRVDVRVDAEDAGTAVHVVALGCVDVHRCAVGCGSGVRLDELDGVGTAGDVVTHLDGHRRVAGRRLGGGGRAGQAGQASHGGQHRCREHAAAQDTSHMVSSVVRTVACRPGPAPPRGAETG
jgi:hypothetical protein